MFKFLLKKNKNIEKIILNNLSISTKTENDPIKVIWKKYDWTEFDKKNSFIENFSSLSYKEQLKIKKLNFLNSFKNVLITLDYDEKLELGFKEKQQTLGENLISNTPDILELTSPEYEKILTSSFYFIDNDSNTNHKIVGKHTRVLDNLHNEGEEEEDYDEQIRGSFELESDQKKNWTSCITKLHEKDHPKDFNLISNHMEEFLKTDTYPVKKYKSFYMKNWNWNRFEIRRTRSNNNMLIVPFNPQILPTEEVEKLKEKLKDYFLNGNGKECKLDSLFFQLLDSKNEFNSEKSRFNLLLGSDKLVETCDGKEFDFFPNNFYPDVFESYEKLNKNLALILEEAKNENKTDILIELDGINGVLATLASKNYKKFFSLQNSLNTCLNTKLNLEKHGLKENDYFKLFHKLSKNKKFMHSVIDDVDENARICFVLQDFKQPLIDFDKKQKKKLLINLRGHKQIKTIILVTKPLFKLEQYCYELMTAERRKDGILGEPFVAVSAKLIDIKLNSESCYKVIRLDRE